MPVCLPILFCKLQILLFIGQHYVPVGKDQEQHLEMARNFAKRLIIAMVKFFPNRMHLILAKNWLKFQAWMEQVK